MCGGWWCRQRSVNVGCFADFRHSALPLLSCHLFFVFERITLFNMSKKVEKKKETHKKLDWSSLSSRFTRDKVSKREGKQIPKDFDIAVQKVQDLRTNIERLTRHGRAYVNVLQSTSQQIMEIFPFNGFCRFLKIAGTFC